MPHPLDAMIRAACTCPDRGSDSLLLVAELADQVAARLTQPAHAEAWRQRGQLARSLAPILANEEPASLAAHAAPAAGDQAAERAAACAAMLRAYPGWEPGDYFAAAHEMGGLSRVLLMDLHAAAVAARRWP